MVSRSSNDDIVVVPVAVGAIVGIFVGVVVVIGLLGALYYGCLKQTASKIYAEGSEFKSRKYRA
jgi:hypothetical protein